MKFFQFWLVMLFSTFLYAAEAEIVRVGLFDHPPLVSLSPQTGGIFVEILEQLAAQENWELHYVPGSWQAGLDRLEAEEIDLLPSFTPSPTRQARFDFNHEPVVSTFAQIYSQQGLNIVSLADLEQRKVVGLRGDIHFQAFQEIINKLGIQPVLQEVDSDLAAFQQVANGEADALVTEYFASLIREKSFALQRTPLYFFPHSIAYGTKKGRKTHLLTALDNYLKKQQSDPASNYYKIIHHHLGQGYENSVQYSKNHIALTDKEQTWLNAHPVLRIAPNPDSPPLEFFDGQGHYQGLVADYMRIIAERLDVRLEVVRKENLSQAIAAVHSHEADIIGSSIPSEALLKQFIFSDLPFYDAKTVFISHGDIEKPVKIEDLAGNKLLVSADWSAEIEFIREQYPQIEIVEVSSALVGLLKLNFREYDYLLTSLPVAAYFSYQQDLSDLKVTGFFTDKPNQDTFMVRKDEPLLRNIMQKAMRSITPEERQRVEDKWLKGLAGMGNLQSLAIDLSQEERAWLKQNPQIKLTTYLDQAPLVIKNQDGSVSGIIPDLFLHFSQAIGQRIELELFESLSDAHQQHKDKALYGHGTLTKTPLYQRQYLLTDAYLNTPLYVFTHKDNLAFIRQDVDLRGRKISILSDFQAYISYLSKIDEVEIIFADSPLEQMRQLMTGEADAIMGHLAYPYLLNQYLMVDLAIAFVAEIDVGIHIGLNPEQTILQGILNKAIQHLSEARKANILAKWNQINATQVTPDLTEAEKTFLKSLPPLRVPLIEHQPPLTFLVEGQAQGYVNELLEQVSNSLDLEIQWIRGLSYSDSLQALKNAELDLLNNYSHTTDRDFVLASKSILTTSFVALGRINSPAIKTFQDIEGKRIVLVKDFKQTQVLQQHYPHLDMLLVNSVNEALRMLRSQEADYYIGNAVHAGYYLYQGMVNDLKIAGELPAESLGNLEFSFGISKQLPLLHSAIDKTLTALSDRQFQALKLKWLHTATDKPKLHLSPTEKAWIKNHPEIVFGTDASWQPYVIPNPDGSITGIEADILAQINQLSGLNIQIRLGSWVDMVEQARQRKIDGLLISTRHPERATDFLFSDSPYSVHKYIYTHKEMLNKTKGMQALTGKRVAFQQGSLVDEKLLKKYAAIPVPVTNNDEMIHLLLKGDVSAVIQGINFRLQLLEHMLFNIDVAFVIPDSKLPLLYSIRKDWPELQGIINKALAIIPHYQRLEILQKWTLQPQEKVNLQQLGLTIAEQHWLSQHPVISVAVDPDWAPLEFIDKQGRLQGISADYLQHLEKLLGVRFEPAQGLSWQEAVKAVKARQLDMFSSVRKTPERARYVNFTEPYLSVPIAFFTGSETHYIGHAEELSGKKVAVVSGYAIEEMLASDHPGIQLVAVKDIPEGLQRLAQGEVYAFADNILTTAYYVRELKLLQLKVAGKTTYANEQAMAARKDLPLLSSILHKALNTIPEAEHNRIYQRWIYLHDQPRFDYVLFWKILLAIALLFAIFIYWNWRLSAEVKHRKKAEQTARSTAEKLRVAELFARETIDALTAHLCVLDAKGMILTVNRAWCKFSEANPPVLPHYGIGTNYVRLCKAASTRNSKEAEIVAAGLQAVLQGKQKTFMLEYPCHSPTQQRWFVMMVSRFADDGPVRVVVAHENITSRKLAEQALEASKDAAEAANHAKSIFLANMSHELRTPLNAILGFSQIMVQDTTINTTQRNNLNTINRAGEHLLAMINDVLDLSKIEAGKIELQQASFDLVQMFQDLAEMFCFRAQNKGLAFHLQLHLSNNNTPLYIKTDQGKLRQVLINLLGNALKFTQQGEIKLRATCIATSSSENCGRLQVTIEDTGMGITTKDLNSIFDPFAQATSSEQSEHKGTGLGLAISRSFIALMGGEITASSTPGSGSCFQFEIPLMAGTAKAVKMPLNVVGLENEQTPWRILIVDDDADNRALLSSLLAPVGFQLREAGNGVEAIAQFQNWTPHFIWLDMRMPIMDGYETARQIRKLPGGDKVKIAAVTASAFLDQQAQVLAAGCDHIVSKPFKSDEIFSALEKHLNVRYVLAQSKPVPQKTVHTPLSAKELAQLPQNVLHALLDAVLQLNAEEILEIITPFQQQHTDITNKIHKLVDNYQYERLMVLCEQALHN